MTPRINSVLLGNQPVKKIDKFRYHLNRIFFRRW